jgi:hypothetical protein
LHLAARLEHECDCPKRYERHANIESPLPSARRSHVQLEYAKGDLVSPRGEVQEGVFILEN